jgi:hypothetical protein
MRYLLVLFTLISFSVSAQNKVIYDENVVTRPAGAFTKIEISGGIDLVLSQSDTEAIAVSAGNEQSRDAIITRIENGVLKIYTDNKSWKVTRGYTKRVAYVSCKQLQKITASGSSDVTIDGSLSGDELSIHLSGASDLKGSLAVNRLKLNQSGASDATLKGTVNDLEIIIAGASEIKAYDLQVENCKATASGASDVKVTVRKALSAVASGASSIYYKGEGNVTSVQSSGASNISKKG